MQIGQNTNSIPSWGHDKREYQWDTIKCLMILCVVFGHMLYHFMDNYILAKGIYVFIYSFHIPMFLFISGMFSVNAIHKNQWNKAIGYLVLYCGMKTLLAIVNGLKTGKVNVHYFWDNTPAWYLFAMAVYLIVTQLFVQKIGLKKLLIYSFFLACIAGYDSHFGDHFVSMRIATFYPFYLMGVFVKEKDIKMKLDENMFWKKIGALSILTGGLVYSLHDANYLYGKIDFLKGKAVFSDLGLSGIQGFIFRAIYYLIVFVLLLCIVTITPKTKNLLSNLGKDTLIVYLIHPIIFAYIFGVKKVADKIVLLFPKTIVVVLFLLSFLIVLILSSIRQFVSQLQKRKSKLI